MIPPLRLKIELLTVIALGEIEVMAPLLRNDEGSVSVEDHVMSLMVLPLILGGGSEGRSPPDNANGEFYPTR